MNHEKLKSRLLLGCKIFFIWLLLQFFIQTFITFQLERSGWFRNAVWMRKEVLLLLFCGAIGREILSNHWKLKTITSHPIKNFILLFIASGILFFLLAILVQKVWLSTFILTVKYDLVPLFIFGLWVCLALLFFAERDRTLIHFYNKIIKFGIRWGLIWRGIVYLMPNGLKFFGYDPHIFEGTIDSRPPAAYYTLIKPYLKGSLVRNQFLFERPINFGFRLIAFFPVFALWFLRKKSIKKQIGYTILFGLLVLSTRSRAAIVMFAIEVVAIFFILHRKSIKQRPKYLTVFFLCLVIWGGITGMFGQKILTREHSTTGHIALIQEGRWLAKQKLVTGRGAGYAGPASHQICYNALENQLDNERCQQINAINSKYEITTYGFNPENQFIQILIEYGILGFIARGAMLIRILYYSAKLLVINRNHLKTEPQKLIYFTVFGFSIGLLGLLGEGLLLHSLSDRMIVYPFFLLYGISIGLFHLAISNNPNTKAISKKKK